MTGPYQYGFDVDDVIRRYRERSSGEIYDALKQQGLPDQAAHPDLLPIRDDMVLAGPAFTVKAVPEKYARPDRGQLWVDMIRDLEETPVPVVEIRDCTNEDRIAMYGDVAATVAARCGAVGTVIDGALRDTRVLAAESYPVFTRFTSPVSGGGWYSVRDWQVPVALRGATSKAVVVNPGDMVLADRDGVVVVPEGVITAVLEHAEERGKKEDSAREAYRTADDIEEVHRRFGRL